MNLRADNQQAGFTLIEILVAFSLLLVGMAGIISMFAAGMRLERAGSLAFDGAVILDELSPEIIEDFRLQRAANKAGGVELRIERSEVKGHPGMTYSARAIPFPDDEEGHGYLVNVFVMPAGVAEEDAFSQGWLPVRLRPRFEELVRKAQEEPEPSSAAGGAQRSR
ncbi:MAG: prepilin-type N-terminal cleavage/methylation domain-containing protein [Planctomycetota bacterium]